MGSTLLGRVEGKARRREPNQMAAKLAALEREQAKAIPPLRKTAKAMRSARLKTETLLKSHREAEHQAIQELTTGPII